MLAFFDATLRGGFEIGASGVVGDTFTDESQRFLSHLFLRCVREFYYAGILLRGSLHNGEEGTSFHFFQFFHIQKFKTQSFSFCVFSQTLNIIFRRQIIAG